MAPAHARQILEDASRKHPAFGGHEWRPLAVPAYDDGHQILAFCGECTHAFHDDLVVSWRPVPMHRTRYADGWRSVGAIVVGQCGECRTIWYWLED